MSLESTQAPFYEHIATLIEYPGETYFSRLRAAAEALRARAALPPGVELFLQSALGNPVSFMEEEYIRTFDFNPECSLEIGWHLYGENYGRGDFLVKMRDLLKRFAIPEASELPDHLSYVLPAFDRLQEREAREFARLYVIPGLKKLMDGIEKKGTLYQAPLAFLLETLQARYGVPVAEGARP